jgi:predicted lipoprotein with Yx(FWY)xxD motif
VRWNRQRIVSAAATAVVVLPVAGIGSGALSASASAAAKQSSSAVEINTAKLGKLGTVLVRPGGRPLYIFEPNSRTHVACGGCQKIWFPLLAPAHGAAKALGAAKQSLIGSVRDPVIGKRVVTYNGWPLYTYVLDKVPDIASGQDILMGGGYWRVLTAAGKVDSTPATHGGGYVGS